VDDVLCTSGPDDRPFEERHSRVGIAVVAVGSFAYRSASGRALLTPGSLLLGNAGQPFECGHEHGRGDRCIAFQYDRELFERLAADAGVRRADRRFRAPRLPPLRAMAPFVARASAAAARLSAPSTPSWEALAYELALRTLEISAGLPPDGGRAPLGAEAKVVRAVRRIERERAADASLDALAAEAALSPYHFLRTFVAVTGVTPHQFVLRARLRWAAQRLAATPERVVDVAYASGFGDLSNFNHAFRAEFGARPTAHRKGARLALGTLDALRAPRPQREAGGTIPRSRA
jgi:AraC-like DNA-binding protein